MTYQDECNYNDAYRKANDEEYQNHLLDCCNLGRIRAKYENLLEKPFKDRDCSVCRQCLCMDKNQMGRPTCDAKLRQKIKELS